MTSQPATAVTPGASLINELKAHRQTLGWSLMEVVDRCGVEERFLADWEHGRGPPRLDFVEGWAAVLGLEPSLVPAQQEAIPTVKIDWETQLITVDGTRVRLTPMEWCASESPRKMRRKRSLIDHHTINRLRGCSWQRTSDWAVDLTPWFRRVPFAGT